MLFKAVSFPNLKVCELNMKYAGYIYVSKNRPSYLQQKGIVLQDLYCLNVFQGDFIVDFSTTGATIIYSKTICRYGCSCTLYSIEQ